MFIRRLISFCLLFYLVTAFAEQDDLSRDIAWLQVSFSAEDVYDGKSSQLIDEVVGPLIEAKIKIRNMHWYKPLYGDQNLLYFPSTYVFADKQMQKLRTNVRQDATHWEMQLGTMEMKEVTFRFVKTRRKVDSFIKQIYACGGSSAHVVYFWGSEDSQQQSAVETFLRQVAKKCQ